MRTPDPNILAWIVIFGVFAGLPVALCALIAPDHPLMAVGLALWVTAGAFRTARLIRRDAAQAVSDAVAARARANRKSALALATRNRAMRARADAVIATHAAALADQRRRLADDAQWRQAVETFIAQRIESTSCRIKDSPALLRAVRETIDRCTVRRAPAAVRTADTTPALYEQSVADGLRALGWRTRLTAPGEDRYVDVVAQLRDKRVVIQCTGFVSPIRASVIQELDEVRARAGADRAALVTNAHFTARARDLATLSGVLIIRHDRLAQLEAEVFGAAQRPERTRVAPPAPPKRAALG